MKVEYYKKLEKAARQTILIHRPDTLIRMLLRTIINSLKITHAGIFIYDKVRDEYIVKISKGNHTFRIPQGFVKIKKDNCLVKYFTDKSLNFNKNHILWGKITSLIKHYSIKKDKKIRMLLEDIKFTLSLYQAKACLPGFFRSELVGILFLGEKIDKKPFSDEELRFLSVLASDVVMALKNAWLIEDLNRQIEINRRMLLQTISALASSIEAKDKYTIGHTERVANYALLIAQALKKYKKIEKWDNFMQNLKIAALLHDIGKIGIPESILNKKLSLNETEREVMHNHPLIGATILNHVEELKWALEGVKYHHEKYDGTGYPYHLKGKKIPLIASIIALADTFDAMITDRPYRKGISINEAIKKIKEGRGKQFVPCIVDAFLRVCHNKKISNGSCNSLNQQLVNH